LTHLITIKIEKKGVFKLNSQIASISDRNRFGSCRVLVSFSNFRSGSGSGYYIRSNFSNSNRYVTSLFGM